MAKRKQTEPGAAPRVFTWGSRGKRPSSIKAHLWEEDSTGNVSMYHSACGFVHTADFYTPDYASGRPCRDCLDAVTPEERKAADARSAAHWHAAGAPATMMEAVTGDYPDPPAPLREATPEEERAARILAEEAEDRRRAMADDEYVHIPGTPTDYPGQIAPPMSAEDAIAEITRIAALEPVQVELTADGIRPVTARVAVGGVEIPGEWGVIEDSPDVDEMRYNPAWEPQPNEDDAPPAPEPYSTDVGVGEYPEEAGKPAEAATAPAVPGQTPPVDLEAGQLPLPYREKYRSAHKETWELIVEAGRYDAHRKRNSIGMSGPRRADDGTDVEVLTMLRVYADDNPHLRIAEAAAEPVQLPLLPAEPPPHIANTVILLSQLPDDAELYGDPPDKSFIASVERLGVLSPILITRKVGAAGYIVADGRNRIKAARILAAREATEAAREGRIARVGSIPARIFPAGWTAAEVLSLVSNEQRRANPASDLRNIEALIHQGFSPAEIGAAIGLTKSEMAARCRLLGLNEELKDALYAGELSASLAKQIAKEPPARQARLLDRYRETGKLTGLDLREAKSAGAAAATALLDDAIFATPGPNQEAAPEGDIPAWLSQVEALVKRAAELIPDTHRSMRQALIRALMIDDSSMATYLVPSSWSGEFTPGDTVEMSVPVLGQPGAHYLINKAGEVIEITPAPAPLPRFEFTVDGAGNTLGVEYRPEGFTPLTLNPPPFSGDDTTVLHCSVCGDPYTMREYRQFMWVEESDVCVPCGSERVSEQIRNITGMAPPALDSYPAKEEAR